MWDFDPCLSFCKNIVLEGLGDLSYLWGHAWHPVSFHSLTILAGQSHNSKVSHCIPLSNFQCTSDVVLKIILLQTGFSNILLLAEKRGTNVSSRDRSKPFLLFFSLFFAVQYLRKQFQYSFSFRSWTNAFKTSLSTSTKRYVLCQISPSLLEAWAKNMPFSFFQKLNFPSSSHLYFSSRNWWKDIQWSLFFQNWRICFSRLGFFLLVNHWF